jgi:hypothetical protein
LCALFEAHGAGEAFTASGTRFYFDTHKADAAIACHGLGIYVRDAMALTPHVYPQKKAALSIFVESAAILSNYRIRQR